jgi:hypothetical protein
MSTSRFTSGFFSGEEARETEASANRTQARSKVRASNIKCKWDRLGNHIENPDSGTDYLAFLPVRLFSPLLWTGFISVLYFRPGRPLR